MLLDDSLHNMDSLHINAFNTLDQERNDWLIETTFANEIDWVKMYELIFNIMWHRFHLIFLNISINVAFNII